MRGTDAGRRGLDQFEKRTNQKIAREIPHQDNTKVDAPVAQGKIAGDGHAAACSSVVPLHSLTCRGKPSPRQSLQQEVTTVHAATAGPD